MLVTVVSVSTSHLFNICSVSSVHSWSALVLPFMAASDWLSFVDMKRQVPTQVVFTAVLQLRADVKTWSTVAEHDSRMMRRDEMVEVMTFECEKYQELDREVQLSNSKYSNMFFKWR